MEIEQQGRGKRSKTADVIRIQRNAERGEEALHAAGVGKEGEKGKRFARENIKTAISFTSGPKLLTERVILGGTYYKGRGKQGLDFLEGRGEGSSVLGKKKKGREINLHQIINGKGLPRGVI